MHHRGFQSQERSRRGTFHNERRNDHSSNYLESSQNDNWRSSKNEFEYNNSSNTVKVTSGTWYRSRGSSHHNYQTLPLDSLSGSTDRPTVAQSTNENWDDEIANSSISSQPLASNFVTHPNESNYNKDRYENNFKGHDNYHYNNSDRREDGFTQNQANDWWNNSGNHNNNEGFKRQQENRNGSQGFDRSRAREDRVENKPGVMKMEIPSGMKGRVIGRGGSVIKDLKEKSGLRYLKVLGEEDDGSYVPVSLEGSDDAIAKAKELIDEIINPKPAFTVPPKVNNPITNARPVFDWGAVREEMKISAVTKWAGLPPLIKEFYVEDPAVASMDPDEVAQLRLQSNRIMVQDLCPDKRAIPNPVQTFEQAFAHYPDILSELYKQGFGKPSPIQMQGWPIVLSGMDLIGIAQTGTGKTIAFLLPAFIHIDGQSVPRNERNGPTVLVLSPTRELALQIEQEVKKYSYHGIKCVCVYGGGSRKEQINTVTKGVEIVVATPGRLNDLINAGVISLKSVSYLVLDEADRMLDLGFEPEIRKVLLDIRPDRHTIMTSATWPEGVRRLAKQYMKDPVQVQVGSLDLTAVHSVTQLVEILPDEEKRPRLIQFLCEELKPDEKVIVFVGKKVTADDISSDLTLQGVYCQSIHGDREQCDREQALQDLKEGTVNILIATDVASRGIDIKDITHVFNFDFPKNIEEYVHRVGRTGRAGRTGTSISLMTRSDWGNAQKLIDIMEEAEQEIPQELVEMAERFSAMRQRRREEGGDRRGSRGRGFGGRGGRGRRDREEGIIIPMYGIA